MSRKKLMLSVALLATVFLAALAGTWWKHLNPVAIDAAFRSTVPEAFSSVAVFVMLAASVAFVAVMFAAQRQRQGEQPPATVPAQTTPGAMSAGARSLRKQQLKKKSKGTNK